MYGVPLDLDLSKFGAAALIQIAIGEHQVQFHFHPEGCISVEGKWELRDSSGAIVDAWTDMNAERDAYRLHVVLGKSVANYSVCAPRSFSLLFESGHTLTVYDDSKWHESFSIRPGDIYV